MRKLEDPIENFVTASDSAQVSSVASDDSTRNPSNVTRRSIVQGSVENENVSQHAEHISDHDYPKETSSLNEFDLKVDDNLPISALRIKKKSKPEVVENFSKEEN